MAVTVQSGIAARISKQETQSQQVFVVLNCMFGAVVALWLARIDLMAGLGWGGVHFVASMVPTVLLFRKARPTVV
ncbi:MAG: hypothetical protein K0R39_4392, partial [Symbiobacteriaceae bacterium]|nr:hypothetical protein [Symbiobacteriaceae bacterium]